MAPSKCLEEEAMIPKEQHVTPSLLRCTTQVCSKPNVRFPLPAKYNNPPEIVSVAHFANDFGRGNEVIATLRVAHEHKFIAPKFGLHNGRQNISESLDDLQIKSFRIDFEEINLFGYLTRLDQRLNGSNRNVDGFRK